MIQDYSFTKHRIFQWLGIILSLGIIAVGYWYYQSQASTLNKSPTSSLTSGLVGYWTFDGADTTSTTATDRGSGNNGTLAGGPTVTNGQVGQALSFDGTDDYVGLGNPSALNISGSITIATWIRFSTSQSNRPILARWGTDESYVLSVSSIGSNVLVFCIRVSDVNKCASSTNTYNDNKWHHVVARFDGTNVRLTINVNQEDIVGDATTGPIDTPSQNVTIGTYNSIAQFFVGSIDEVRIYNRALSATEIQSLYALGQSDTVNASNSQPQGTGRLDSGLAGYWALDNGSGTSATDSSTNANTGTLTNGPTWTTGQIGSAVNLDGTDDYIDMGTAGLTAPTRLSGAAWVKIDDIAFNKNHPIFSNRTAGNAGWSFVVYGGTTCSPNPDCTTTQFTIQGVASYNSTTTAIYEGQWTHLAFSWDGSSVSFYSNGVLIGTSATGSMTTGSSLLIGTVGPSPGSSFLDGLVDEARVYTRALSADEISQLYRLTSPTGVDTSLKGYWSFNGKDLSGTTAFDRSGAGNNGTLTNGPATTQGKIGQAIQFDGSDDYVSIGDQSSLRFGASTSFSISAWIKTTTTSNGYAVCDYNLDNTIICLGVNNTGNTNKAYFFLRDSAATTSTTIHSNNIVNDGKWHQLVGVRNASSNSMTIFIDGIQDVTTTYSGSLSFSTLNSWSVGRAGAQSATYFTGAIDEVRVYNTALTAAQIQALYAAGASDEVNTSASQAQGTGRLDSGLAGYWALDNGSGTSATDSSTNGNTGTLTNGPTWTTGQIGGAVDLDGSNDYVDLGTSTTYINTTAPFTVSLWVNLDTFNSSNHIPFTLKTNSTNGWAATFVNCCGYADVTFGKDTASGKKVSFPGGLTTGSWRYLTIVYNGGGFDTTANYTVYVDAVSTAVSASTTLGGIDNENALGRARDTGSPYGYFDGKLDEFRVYNRALSADEVAQLYRLTSPTGVDTSLKGYWSFNGKDMSGTSAFDRSGAGNTGTLTNGPTVTQGRVGQALSFDGTDDYVSIPDVNSLDITGAITLSAWLRTSSSTGCIMGKSNYAPDICFGNSTAKVYELGILSNTIYFQIGNGVTAVALSGSASSITNDAWHLVTATWDGTTGTNGMKIYIDGVMAYQGTSTVSSIVNSSSSLNFGGNNGSVDYNGKLDEVRIYNRALGASEIAALYNAGR